MQAAASIRGSEPHVRVAEPLRAIWFEVLLLELMCWLCRLLDAESNAGRAGNPPVRGLRALPVQDPGR